eukprot:g4969.t1
MGPSYSSCSCATAGSGNFLRQCPGGESCAKGDCCTSDLCPGIGHSIDWVSLGRRFATCQGEAHFLGYVFVSVVQSCAYLATEDARCDASNAVTLFQDGRCYCCAQPQTDVGPSSQILEFFADMFILTRRDVCILNDVVATPKTNASPGNCSGLDRLSEDEFCVPVCDEGYDLSAPTSCEPGITPSLRVGRCFEDFDLGVEGYVAAVESDDNSSSSDSGGGHSDDVATIVYEMNISSWPLCKGYGAAGKCAQVAVERAAVDISLQTLSTITGIPNDARLNVSFVGFGATSTASTATRLPRLCTNEESGCASYVDGDVRMTSGTNENLSLPLGLLEMYTDGAFRPVCGHLFVDDDNGADAACRSLGYPDGGRVVILQDDTLYASYRQASEGSVHVGKCGATDRIDNCTELCCVDGITLDFGYDRPTSNPSHACSNRYDVGCGSCYPRLDDFAYICNTPSNHCPWPHYFEIECVGRRRLAPIDVTSALKDALLAQESTCASAQSRNACENSAANVRCVWLDDDDNNDGGGNTTKCWSNFSGVVALTITLENVDEGSNGMTTENVSVSSETFESVRLQSLTSSDAALQVQCDRVMISNDATACSRVVECSRLANTSAPCVTMSFDGMNVQRVDAGAFLDFASTLVVISFRDNRALREVPTWMNVGLGSSLREMYLDEVGFETLSTGRFDGLAGLEMLSMSSIPTLVSIESGAFDGLVALRTLDLSHSGLSSFSQGMFGASLQNLRVLYLGHTPTTSISDGTFDGLDHLEELYLEHCNLEGEIGGDQLRGLSRRLRRLVLSNNGGIRGVSPDAFDSMRQEPPGSRRRRLASDDGVNSSGLESLWLNGGSIENLAPGTFSNMPNLTELMLFSNRLSVLRREIFADLVSLDTLHIQDNCIGTIEARAFANDRAIRRLDLSDQCLTRIEDDAFADTAFDEIDLSGNNVRYLSPDAFRNWTMELTNVSANVSQFSCEDRSEWSISENLTSLGRDVDSCSDFVALPDDVRGRLLAFRGSGDLTASQACW